MGNRSKYGYILVTVVLHCQVSSVKHGSALLHSTSVTREFELFRLTPPNCHLDLSSPFQVTYPSTALPDLEEYSTVLPFLLCSSTLGETLLDFKENLPWYVGCMIADPGEFDVSAVSSRAESLGASTKSSLKGELEVTALME